MECGISYALGKLNATDRCIPWYLPPVDPQVRVCDPFEARDFNKEIEFMSADVCKVVRKGVVQRLIAKFYSSTG